MRKWFLVCMCLVSVNAFAGLVAQGAALVGTCGACHGEAGHSTVPAWPSLAGQHDSYTLKQLKDFKGAKPGDEDGRYEPTMTPLMAKLSDADMKAIAAYYQAQAQPKGKADQALVKRGQQLYRGGDIKKQIAACSACHSPTGSGNSSAAYPVLAGQQKEYTENQLRAFKEGVRTNDTNGIMRSIAKRMSEKDIKAVASYISGLRAQ